MLNWRLIILKVSFLSRLLRARWRVVDGSGWDNTAGGPVRRQLWLYVAQWQASWSTIMMIQVIATMVKCREQLNAENNFMFTLGAVLCHAMLFYFHVWEMDTLHFIEANSGIGIMVFGLVAFGRLTLSRVLLISYHSTASGYPWIIHYITRTIKGQVVNY